MKHGKVVPAIAAFVFLAGCGASSLPLGNADSTVEEKNTGEQIYSAEYDDALKEDASEHGYPFLLDECSLDLNGDQLVDKAKLLQEWYPIFDESGAPSFEKGSLHYATLQFLINGDIYSYTFDDASYNSTLSLMQTSEGKSICVVTLDVGGTGGGNIAIYPVIFDDDGIKVLPLPILDDQTGWTYRGFEAKVTYSDGYLMKIEVPETGYVDSIKLPLDGSFDLSMYDEDGTCSKKGLQGLIYGASSAKVVSEGGKTFLEIAQYISGKNAASEGVGYLISRISWEDGTYQVINQRVSSL